MRTRPHHPPSPPSTHPHHTNTTTNTNTNTNTNKVLGVLCVRHVPDRWFRIGSRTTSSRAKRAGHPRHLGRLVPLPQDTTVSWKWLRQKKVGYVANGICCKFANVIPGGVFACMSYMLCVMGYFLIVATCSNEQCERRVWVWVCVCVCVCGWVGVAMVMCVQLCCGMLCGDLLCMSLSICVSGVLFVCVCV